MLVSLLCSTLIEVSLPTTTPWGNVAILGFQEFQVWFCIARLKTRWLPKFQYCFQKSICQQSLEYAECTPYRRVRLLPPTPEKIGCSAYDTKLHLVMRLYFKRSRECGVPLHCHYSQVHSDPEWLYLLGSHLWKFSLDGILDTI